MKATLKREYEQKRIKRMKEEPKETTAQQALNELKEKLKGKKRVITKIGEGKWKEVYV